MSGHASWVVVLEAATGIDHSILDRVVHALAEAQALGLYSPDRFAVQMEVAAGGQPEALFVALTRLRAALVHVGEAPIEIARAEVLSREEFERECRLAYGDEALPKTEAAVGPLRPVS